MNDKFTKFILVGILLCLMGIANQSTNNQIASPMPNIDNSVGKQVIQLAPNRIAVIDNENTSGIGGTILVFDYNSNTKKFNYVSSMNYEDYFNDPTKYGIPTE